MKRVLIVEDSELSVDILKVLLEKYDFKIDVVENGESAMDFFKKSIEQSDPYELIFLDIMMPKKNGQEVLEEIRNIEKNNSKDKNKKTKIIMTTSLDNFDNVYKSFKNKCDGYLVKPILKEKLDLLMRNLT